MLNHIKKSVGTILLVVSVLGCSNNKESAIKITIESKTQPNADVTLFHRNNIQETILSDSETDSSGNCTFEVALEKPMLVMVKIGEKYGEVYLTPNHNLTIRENGKDYRIPLTFSGDSKQINNCLSWFNSTFEKIRWGEGNIPILTKDQYLDRLDSLRVLFTDFKSHYQDSTALSDEELKILDNKSKIKLLSFQQEYYFFQYNNLVNENFAALNNGNMNGEVKTSKDLEIPLDDVPFDSSFLSYADYQMLLNMFWHNKIELPSSEIIGPNGSFNLVPVISDSLIRKFTLPNGICEYLRAFNLNIWLNQYGIKPETDSVFADYKRTYRNSKYLPALNKAYQEWLALSPGTPAPYFSGTTPDGKTISINDLKGKIVYVDVWATWCAPCRAEIPFSKKLQKEFSNEKNIVFVNISMDRNRSAWERFLEEDNTWKGYHIIIDEGKTNEFYKNYKINGIPAYFLIDISGNIIYTKAPPPSDKEISGLIKKYIASR